MKITEKMKGLVRIKYIDVIHKNESSNRKLFMNSKIINFNV